MTGVVLHPVVRTQDEIVARLREVQAGQSDFFGVIQSDLAEALDFEHAREFLKPGATPAQWAESISKRPETWARDYVAFALAKAEDHRGLSASRSIDHLRTFAWLLGWDLPDEPYAQYGVPLIYAYLEHFGWLDLWPHDNERLQRMRDGAPCEPGCDEGCVW